MSLPPSCCWRACGGCGQPGTMSSRTCSTWRWCVWWCAVFRGVLCFGVPEAVRHGCQQLRGGGWRLPIRLGSVCLSTALVHTTPPTSTGHPGGAGQPPPGLQPLPLAHQAPGERPAAGRPGTERVGRAERRVPHRRRARARAVCAGARVPLPRVSHLQPRHHGLAGGRGCRHRPGQCVCVGGGLVSVVVGTGRHDTKAWVVCARSSLLGTLARPDDAPVTRPPTRPTRCMPYAWSSSACMRATACRSVRRSAAGCWQSCARRRSRRRRQHSQHSSSSSSSSAVEMTAAADGCVCTVIACIICGGGWHAALRQCAREVLLRASGAVVPCDGVWCEQRGNIAHSRCPSGWLICDCASAGWQRWQRWLTHHLPGWHAGRRVPPQPWTRSAAVSTVCPSLAVPLAGPLTHLS